MEKRVYFKVRLLSKRKLIFDKGIFTYLQLVKIENFIELLEKKNLFKTGFPTSLSFSIFPPFFRRVEKREKSNQFIVHLWTIKDFPK